MRATRSITILLGVLFMALLVVPAARAASPTVSTPGVATAQLMPPPPNCFNDYASIYSVSYNSTFNTTSGRVNVYDVPGYSTIYIQVNGGPVNEYTASSSGFFDKTFTALGNGASVYVSVYSGSYWVCSGSDSTGPLAR